MSFIPTDLNIIKKYFDAFNNKDLVSLDNLINENIYLKDWIVEINGKDNVINMFRDIFTKNKLLHIDVLNFFYNENTFAAEIKININNKEILEVVDLIEIKDNKITSIKAYKC